MRKTTLAILILTLAAIVYEDVPSIIQGNSLAMYAAAAAVSVLEATFLTGIWYAKSIGELLGPKGPSFLFHSSQRVEP